MPQIRVIPRGPSKRQRELERRQRRISRLIRLRSTSQSSETRTALLKGLTLVNRQLNQIRERKEAYIKKRETARQ